MNAHVASPVAVCLAPSSDVVSSGLTSILLRYPQRIRLVRYPPRPADLVDIVLVDTAHGTHVERAAARWLAPTSRTIVVVMAWNGAVEGRSLASADGAHGFLLMTLNAREMVTRLELLSRLDKNLPAQAAPSHEGRWPGVPPEPLSGRESQVIGLVCRGLSNQDIAHELFLSINTVKTYIRSAYRKVGVTRRSQAVLWGLSHGRGTGPRDDLTAGPIVGAVAATLDV